MLSNIEKKYIRGILLRYAMYVLRHAEDQQTLIETVDEYLTEEDEYIKVDLELMESEKLEEEYIRESGSLD